jgi:hypothetical protein
MRGDPGECAAIPANARRSRRMRGDLRLRGDDLYACEMIYDLCAGDDLRVEVEQVSVEFRKARGRTAVTKTEQALGRVGLHLR